MKKNIMQTFIWVVKHWTWDSEFLGSPIAYDCIERTFCNDIFNVNNVRTLKNNTCLNILYVLLTEYFFICFFFKSHVNPKYEYIYSVLNKHDIFKFWKNIILIFFWVWKHRTWNNVFLETWKSHSLWLYQNNTSQWQFQYE